MKPLHIYATSHVNSRTVCAAFAEGSNGIVVEPAPLLPGAAFMYGALRGLAPTLRQAQREGREWFYGDNGYMRAGHFAGYYRVTRNAYQHHGHGVSDGSRLAALGIKIKPWRKVGSHIVVCPPSKVWSALMGIDGQRWFANTVARIEAATNRPIWVRDKSSTAPIAEDLRNAWALVTYTSNAAVDALIAGVPVICTGPCAATSMSGAFYELDAPILRDRTEWLGVLADNQWTLDEIRKGVAWQTLRAGFTSTAAPATAA